VHYIVLSHYPIYICRPPKDQYYDTDAEDKDKKREDDLKKKKHLQTYVRRVIVHPSFKNISFKELIPLMDQMDQGEVIIRPSSKVRSLKYLLIYNDEKPRHYFVQICFNLFCFLKKIGV
jgi:hypothetical protein